MKKVVAEEEVEKRKKEKDKGVMLYVEVKFKRWVPANYESAPNRAVKRMSRKEGGSSVGADSDRDTERYGGSLVVCKGTGGRYNGTKCWKVSGIVVEIC